MGGCVRFAYYLLNSELAMADNAAEALVYMGEGSVVPRDVVRVRIDPSVLAIPEYAFKERTKLKKVQLHDGLREIGLLAFNCCTALNGLQLSGGVESIGSWAFSNCVRFTKFRCPPLVTTIPHSMLHNCTGLFSLELPEIIIQVEGYAFCHCYSLRNIALASNTAVAGETALHAFQFCTDLLQIFGTEEAIVNALRNRFDGLPVHCKMYFISYYPVVLEEFRNIIMSENGERDPTGLHQDCLGMTPLHILACSTVQCLELYQVMIENYPESLIVEDAWGAVPLFYAIWGDAPSEIVELLVKSYQSLYPNHEFDWNDMVITMGRANASTAVIQNLLDIQQSLSPEYSIDWDQILGELTERAKARPRFTPFASSTTLCFLMRCSIEKRVNAIGVKHFRDAMAGQAWRTEPYDWMINDDDFNREAWYNETLTKLEYYESEYFNREAWYNETLTKLEYYESEYLKLKEVTSLLELALWKIKLDDSLDPSEFRLQCRISCGADHVIENVFPFLLPPDYDVSSANRLQQHQLRQQQLRDEDDTNVEHRWLRRVRSVPARTVHTFLSRWRRSYLCYEIDSLGFHFIV
jgi:hypothetical protein